MKHSAHQRATHPKQPLCAVALACRLAIAAASAAATVAAVAPAHASVYWTGNAPVLTARWFNGVSLETPEFAYLLDWQGYCNAHLGSVCSSVTFWNSRGNWDVTRPPTEFDDVNVGAGAEVWVSSYDSSVQGQISGFGQAGFLSAGDATIGIGLSSTLTVGAATIGKLKLTPGSTFVSIGESIISNLSVAEGMLRGGSTVINSIGASYVDLRLSGGHTLNLANSSPTPLTLRMADQSAFINHQELTGTNRVTCDVCTTYEAIYTPSIFRNKGTIKGPMSISYVRFNNDGEVDMQAGLFSALNSGQHTGTFKGAAGSEMVFGSIGAGSLGHQFLSQSSVQSDGRVAFSGSGHRIAGSYDVATTAIGGPVDNADVTFAGSAAKLGLVSVGTSSNVHFETGGTQLRIEQLNVDTAQSFAFFTGAASSVGSVVLNAGGINTTSALAVTDSFIWRSGTLIGSFSSAGTGTFEAGTRDLRATLVNTGKIDWNGGSFSNWAGVLDNRAGATFALNGDFGITAASGRFDNAGTLRKAVGSGRSVLALPFNNSGAVEVLAGTLALTGIDGHTGTFTAAPGALLQLAGKLTIGTGPSASFSGRVDVTGGSFTVLAGAGYTNAAGNGVSADIVIGSGASFTNAGNIGWAVPSTTTISNAGNLANLAGGQMLVSAFDNRAGASFTNGGGFSTGATLAVLSNAGNLVNQPGAQMVVSGFTNRTGASFTNGGLVGMGTALLADSTNAGSLVNQAGGRMTVVGLDNSGSLVNGGELTVDVLGLRNSGTISNTGTLTFAGGSSSGSIVNTGSFTNRGTFTLNGTTASPATITNTGTLTNSAFFTIGSNGSVTGAGRYVQTGNDTYVDGVLEALGGIDIQAGSLGGTGKVVGDVVLGIYATLLPGNSPGTLSVNGNVGISGASYNPGANLQIEIASASLYDRLLVSGNVSFNEAKVDLMFLSGYVLNDGDSFGWLTAGSISDHGMTTKVSGLPADWSSRVTNTGTALRLEVLNEPVADWTTQIARSGSVLIAPATVASNWAGAPTALTALTNAGSFVNQPGATLATRSLTNEAGALLVNHGVLRVDCCSGPITNAGMLRNRAGAELVLGANVSNSGSLINQGTATLTAGLTNLAGGRVETPGVLNHQATGQAIVNRGVFIVGGTLNTETFGRTGGLNFGTVRNEGGEFTVLAGGRVQGNGSYVQSYGDLDDGSTRVDGTLAASRIRFDSGRLSGSGTLVGPVVLGGVLVAPGNSPGTLTIDGSLAANYTTFEIELGSATLADQLHVTGAAAFTGGTVEFLLTDGYTPRIGDGFTWLDADGSISGLDSLYWRVYTVTGSGANTVLWEWQTPSDMRLSFHDGRLDFNAAAVPEPQTWALWLLGLAAGAGLASRGATSAGRLRAGADGH